MQFRVFNPSIDHARTNSNNCGSFLRRKHSYVAQTLRAPTLAPTTLAANDQTPAGFNSDLRALCHSLRLVANADTKLPVRLHDRFVSIDSLKSPSTLIPLGPEVLRNSQRVLKECSDGEEPDKSRHFRLKFGLIRGTGIREVS